jgi:tryptophan synthase beta chain
VESYFGYFGGQFVAETLMQALTDLEASFELSLADDVFSNEIRLIHRDIIGRPTPLTPAKRLSTHLGGPQIYLKREDLTHTGAHKINNAISQALLAKKMGKKRIVAETGAGQHGVATATACAMLGLQCVVYMGAVDAARQASNVARMKLCGAELRLVHSGSQTLKDAINEAIRDWITNVEDTHYLIGSVVGPHPFPTIVRTYQSIIGTEARTQILDATGRLPSHIIACVGGGSNAMGLFHAFLNDETVQIFGVQAAGDGLDTERHAAPLIKGRVGVLHGAKTLVNQDTDGQIQESHSIAPGLDYPGVGPQHASLKKSGRVNYVAINDKQALAALQLLCKLEGILPALESSHAVAYALELAPQLDQNDLIIINISGRGDKDLTTVMRGIDLGGGPTR